MSSVNSSSVLDETAPSELQTPIESTAATSTIDPNGQIQINQVLHLDIFSADIVFVFTNDQVSMVNFSGIEMDISSISCSVSRCFFDQFRHGCEHRWTKLVQRCTLVLSMIFV